MAPHPDNGIIIPDDKEPLDFAHAALGRMSMLAADIGFREKSATAGCLAAELWIAKKAIESVEAAHSEKLERRSFKLMRQLERICCWPNPPAYGRQSILRNLVQPVTRRDAQQAESRACVGLVKFLHGPDFIKQEWFKQLERFSNVSQNRPAMNDGRARQATDAAPDEHPREVNAMLYNVLRDHATCTCLDTQRSGRKYGRHAARLKLKAGIVRLSDSFGFDMLIQSWPAARGHWQDLQLRVKTKSKKNVRYHGDAHGDPTKVCDGELSRPLELGSLCDLVNIRLESRLNLQVQNSQLYQLYEGIPIQQRIGSDPSVPLRRVLETYRLSNKMKLSASKSSRGESLYASNPYFVVAFDTADTGFQEYCESYSVIFRYPRIIALCVVLLEVMRGRAFDLAEFDTAEASINAKWDLASRTVQDSSQWINFEYTDFRSSLQKCLASKTFDQASKRTGSGWNDLKHDLEERRKILYDVLVEPLHRLVGFLGFENALNQIEPMIPSEPRCARPQLPNVPRNPAHNTVAEDKVVWAAIDWIERIGQLSGLICDPVKLSLHKTPVRPVRVAVLDSGYDEDSTFFQTPLRSRQVKGWKDFAGESADPVDENGHGTHTVALVMKLAPTADIYVARIARDREYINEASQAICQAIKWATEVCDVDIISMSFGFESEIPEISIAIREAELAKRDNLLFFAAASNSGGNRREMFPASHDAVISVRQTNANGSFADTNPPADPHGPAVFGTLGSNVPSAWLSNVDGEVAKSGSSVATAVLSSLAHASANPAVETVIEHDHELSQGRGRSVRAGLWAHFLQTVGVGADARRDADVSAEYQIDRLETRYLRDDDGGDPLAAEKGLRARLDEPRVRAVMKARVLGRRVPVYMISGLKIARGLRVRRETRRTVGGGVSGDVPVAPDGVLAGVGGEFGAERRDEQTSSFRGGEEDVIFAYELSVIRLRGRKDRETVEVDILEHAAALLHEEDKPKENEENTEITVGAADVEGIMESGVEVKATKVQDKKGDVVVCAAVP
ncbi:subtilisin-like protein [Apiospora hydei]|uniref:Subtilisin-like protein n=1 Tax=Apiospora hydei TaxID=1337664 RepID=A0ABR1VJM1_9PEZI